MQQQAWGSKFRNVQVQKVKTGYQIWNERSYFGKQCSVYDAIDGSVLTDITDSKQIKDAISS